MCGLFLSGFESWDVAFQYWINGRAINEQQRLLIQNWLMIHGARGTTCQSDDDNSDDLVSDDEFVLQTSQLDEAMTTTLGGCKRKSPSDMFSQQDNSAAAIAQGDDMVSTCYFHRNCSSKIHSTTESV